MIRIVLPYPLPTWNRVLAMHHWERKKLRDWIHASISALSATGDGTTTPMEYRLKPSWMALYGEDYYQMIRPSTSGKSRSRASSGRVKKGRKS